MTLDYIRENQSKILLSLDLPNFTELIDMKLKGRDFIYSMSEPFNEEDIGTDVTRNWLKHFNLKLHQIHASGHCLSCDLSNIVEAIRPKKLFSIHIEEPEYFKKLVEKSQGVIPLKEKLLKIS